MPSEKAMGVAEMIQRQCTASTLEGDYSFDDFYLKHCAEHLESYAAEALAEHMRVLDETEKALQEIIRHDVSVGTMRSKGPFGTGEHPKLGKNPNGTRWATPAEIAQGAIAAIAKLKGKQG